MDTRNVKEQLSKYTQRTNFSVFHSKERNGHYTERGQISITHDAMPIQGCFNEKIEASTSVTPTQLQKYKDAQE